MSKFIYEPDERLWQSHEIDDCECGGMKLKTEDRCPICKIRARREAP